MHWPERSIPFWQDPPADPTRVSEGLPAKCLPLYQFPENTSFFLLKLAELVQHCQANITLFITNNNPQPKKFILIFLPLMNARTESSVYATSLSQGLLAVHLGTSQESSKGDMKTLHRTSVFLKTSETLYTLTVSFSAHLCSEPHYKRGLLSAGQDLWDKPCNQRDKFF